MDPQLVASLDESGDVVAVDAQRLPAERLPLLPDATIIDSPRRGEAVATLRAAVARMSDVQADFAQRVEADLGFHLLLCEVTGNPMLVDSWRHLEGRIRVAIMSHDADQLPDIMAGDRHAPIVDALEAGDVSAAVAVVQQHMTTAAELYAPP